MNFQERALFKKEAEERRRAVQEAKQEERKQRKVAPDDVDPATLPLDYVMPHVARVSQHIWVGPPCITERHKLYLRDRLGNPQVIEVKLPPAAERKLWKAKEAAQWYLNYVRTLKRDTIDGTHASVYLCHDTGCDEEVIVALLLWVLLEPDSAEVPRSASQFEAWRVEHEFLWLLDRNEDTLLDVLEACMQELETLKRASKSSACMNNWLKRK